MKSSPGGRSLDGIGVKFVFCLFLYIVYLPSKCHSNRKLGSYTFDAMIGKLQLPFVQGKASRSQTSAPSEAL